MTNISDLMVDNTYTVRNLMISSRALGMECLYLARPCGLGDTSLRRSNLTHLFNELKSFLNCWSSFYEQIVT